MKVTKLGFQPIGFKLVVKQKVKKIVQEGGSSEIVVRNFDCFSSSYLFQLAFFLEKSLFFAGKKSTFAVAFSDPLGWSR
jgi:hypothetical protein